MGIFVVKFRVILKQTQCNLNLFFNAQFNGPPLTVCAKIRAYIIMTFSMNASQFFISRSFFLISVVLLAFLMD